MVNAFYKGSKQKSEKCGKKTEKKEKLNKWRIY